MPQKCVFYSFVILVTLKHLDVNCSKNEMFFRKSFRFNLQQKHTQNHRNVKANIKTKQRKRKNVPIRNIYSVQMQSYTKEFRGKRFFCKL